jgi:hypothetical protein
MHYARHPWQRHCSSGIAALEHGIALIFMKEKA